MWIYRPDMVKYQKINESIRLNSSIKLSYVFKHSLWSWNKSAQIKQQCATKEERSTVRAEKRPGGTVKKKYIILIIVIVHHYYQILSGFKNQDSKVHASIGLA